MTNLEPGRRESPRRPKVTIAIPTFNRATWVKGGVLAALTQTYQNYEIVVSRQCFKHRPCRRALSSGVKKPAAHVSRTARVCSFG